MRSSFNPDTHSFTRAASVRNMDAALVWDFHRAGYAPQNVSWNLVASIKEIVRGLGVDFEASVEPVRALLEANNIGIVYW